MPFYALHALDRPGASDLRASLRPAHRERLRVHDHPVTVRIGGPLLDAAGAMTGSLLVVEAARIEDVEAYVAADPYVVAGLFETVEIRGFAWGLGQPEEAHG